MTTIPILDVSNGVHWHEHSVAPRQGQAAPTPEENDRTRAAMLEGHLAALDAHGVNWVAVHSPFYYRRVNGLADTRKVNDFTAAYRAQCPERIVASFGVVEPLYCEDALPEIDRCMNELGMSGMGFHARFQSVSTESYWVLRLVERIIENGGVPTIVAMGESPEEMLWKVARVAHTFPDSEMIVVTMFSTWEALSEAYAVAPECPNITWDTALAYDWDMVEDFVKVMGAERVCFGSGLHVPVGGAPRAPAFAGAEKDRLVYPAPRPGRRMTHVLSQFRESDISDDEKRLIGAGNVTRILGLDLTA